MSKILAIVLAVTFVLSFTTVGLAASPKEVTTGMGHKLTRGIVNAGTGWVEFFKEIYHTGKENPLLGLTVGSVKGSAKTAVRTTAGGIESGTFLFPVPKDYNEPLIQPEYVF